MNTTTLVALRAKRSGGKIHRSSKNPLAPARYAGETVCGRNARDMAVVEQMSDTDPGQRCSNCWKGTEWAVASTPTVVRGHGLVREGAPFDEAGRISYDSVGRGECGCGEKSPVLSSTNARKLWHREHKATVRAAGA